MDYEGGCTPPPNRACEPMFQRTSKSKCVIKIKKNEEKKKIEIK